jgi:Domain of unknown function (DUF4406)
MKLYLSGPMTGIKNQNRPRFNKYAKALRRKGHKVVNPPELDRVSPQHTWEGCLRRDIVKLMDCDKIAVMPGWKQSRGANLEVHIGKALKFPVHTVAYWLKKGAL